MESTRMTNDQNTALVDIISGKKALKVIQSSLTYTDITMKSLVLDPMYLFSCANYSGKVTGVIPLVIENSQTQWFEHMGDRSGNSMGCVVYFGRNVHSGCGDVECAWLLAWYTPTCGTDAKVYVKTGLGTDFNPDKLDMYEVKKRLENSTTTSYFKDQSTGTEAFATIDGSGNTAIVAAVFNVLPRM